MSSSHAGLITDNPSGYLAKLKILDGNSLCADFHGKGRMNLHNEQPGNDITASLFVEDAIHFGCALLWMVMLDQALVSKK